jgi:hypothetical protein
MWFEADSRAMCVQRRSRKQCVDNPLTKTHVVRKEYTLVNNVSSGITPDGGSEMLPDLAQVGMQAAGISSTWAQELCPLLSIMTCLLVPCDGASPGPGGTLHAVPFAYLRGADPLVGLL